MSEFQDKHNSEGFDEVLISSRSTDEEESRSIPVVQSIPSSNNNVIIAENTNPFDGQESVGISKYDGKSEEQEEEGETDSAEIIPMKQVKRASLLCMMYCDTISNC